MSYMNDPDGSGVRTMEFKVIGTVEAKSPKEALRMVPPGFVITGARSGIEVKSDLEFTYDFAKTVDKLEACKITQDDLAVDRTMIPPMKKGVNIEGLARQRDVNKLAKNVAEINGTLFEAKPMASKEDMDKLVKRIERLEMTAVPLEEEYNGDRHYLVNDTVINPDGSKHRAIDAKPPCPFDEVARCLSEDAQEALDKATE